MPSHDTIIHAYIHLCVLQVFSLNTVGEEDGPELKQKKKRNASAEGGVTIVCCILCSGLTSVVLQGTLLKLSEAGTQFRSYYDGKKIDLTPESTVQVHPPSAHQTSSSESLNWME